MARTVRDANLETRTARQAEPYWRGLETGLALGYRRRATGGTWLARRRRPEGGYAEYRLGLSDDLQAADGVTVLDYGQAQKAAREWWRAERRREEGHEEQTGPFTVATAIADYLKNLERRGGKSVYHARRAAETHILPPLGSLQVASARRLSMRCASCCPSGSVARAKPSRCSSGSRPSKAVSMPSIAAGSPAS